MPHLLMVIWLCVRCCGLALTASTGELSKANNAFAVDLYKAIGDANSGENVFFSPISISTTLGMVSLGARGKTREQTKQVLHLDKISSDDAVKESYKQFITAIKGGANNASPHMVNRIFGSKVFEFDEQFLQDTQNYFQSTLESLDFARKPDESRRHINQWVEDQTNQKIKDLLPSRSIDSTTILVIANAVYLRALLVTPFDLESTKLRPFNISKNLTGDVESMQLIHKYFAYHSSSELKCQVLELPYERNKASMYVFLPNDIEGLPDLEKQLTVENLVDTVSKMQRVNMKVQLPKFMIDQDISLKQFLQAMGMVELFDEAKADLSGIGSGRLVVTDAVHKAIVNVIESGTDATDGADSLVKGASPNPIAFIADRPFLFLIYEKNTKSVLFTGRLVRPRASKESIGKFGETAAQHGTASSITTCFSGVMSVLLLVPVFWRLQ